MSVNFVNRLLHKIAETRYLISFGFGLSIGLFALVILLGLQQIDHTHERIQSIVGKHNVKTDLITQMMQAARERSLNLYHMVSIEDAFERDDIFMQFNGHSARFGHARSQLVTMNLTDEEKKLLEEQRRYTRATVPIQDHIIDLMNDDEIGKAYSILVNTAVPYQDKVIRTLNRLTVLQQKYASNIAIQSELRVNKSSSIILMLSLVALSLSIIIAINVTRRALHSERTLQIEKDLAEVTLQSIGDAVITTDKDSIIKDMNTIAEQLTGWSKASAISIKLSEIFKIQCDHTQCPITDPLSEAIHSNRIVTPDRNTTLIGKNETEFAIEYTAAPISDLRENIHGGIIVFRDVTPMRTMAYQLSYQASHDALTGLLNRREFEVRVEQVIGHARSEHQSHILCYLDLDQFKIINDTCGHIAGDELLKQISIRLKEQLRDSDVIARLGGDEFGLLLEGCSIEKAKTICENILAAVKQTRFIWDDKSFEVGVSIGMVPINNMSGNVSDVLSAADTACYEAKDQGRNRIHVYTTDDDDLAKRRGEMNWIHRITHALDNNMFVLYYQEIVDMAPDQTNVRYFELLIRMKNDDGSIVPPMAFIPAAERYNMMPIIDKAVVQMALNKLKQVSNDDTDIHFSINISGQSLSTPNFLDLVVDVIDKTGVNPEKIIFEITETAAIANLTHAIRFIHVLKDLGCEFALDDFGSGLSSFAYLKNIPVDYLKIDGYFVRDIIDDPTDAAFVESINQIGQVMGIKTIAEYVENAEILEKLHSIGVSYAQGFYFGKPKPLTELDAELINKDKKPSSQDKSS